MPTMTNKKKNTKVSRPMVLRPEPKFVARRAVALAIISLAAIFLTAQLWLDWLFTDSTTSMTVSILTFLVSALAAGALMMEAHHAIGMHKHNKRKKNFRR